MNSMPNPTAADPNDDLVARADQRLAHAYEQIARADEQLSRVTENLSHMDRGGARKPADRPRGRPARRALVGLLLAGGIFAAAFVWQSPLTDAVRPTIAQWLPRFVSTSAPASDPSPPLQTSASAPRLAAAAATSPTASAPAAAQNIAPPAAAVPAELAQMLQAMARDLANLERGLDQLKNRQEQLAGDNARAIDQLRTSQDQIARDNAKTAEQLKAMASFTARVRQAQQPTPSAAAAQRTNATAPSRPPAPTRPPPQARVQP